MLSLGPVSAARLASLVSGRGGLPDGDEWLVVSAVLLVVAVAGTRLLLSAGLTLTESILIAAVSPILVLGDIPLGSLSPTVGLAANLTGCVIPALVCLKILAQGRVPWAELAFLLCLGIVVSYFASHVDPTRGVLLHYRVPAVVLGLLAAGLLFRVPERAGAAGFVSGTLGVILGADGLHLRELAEGAGSGRVVLGGAGLLDGIILVAILSAALAVFAAYALRAIVRLRLPEPDAV